jgi:uncharacterized protein (DUF924 family)
MLASIDEIHHYWFGELVDGRPRENRFPLWFGGGDAVDAEIRQRFESSLLAAEAGELDGWADSPRGRLALILLLDQFPLNIYRRLARAYDFEAQAIEHCLTGLDTRQDEGLSFFERMFFYMPLEHAEDLALQERCVSLFQQLYDADLREQAQDALDYAREHRDIITRFGRFPHRNRVLGREPTQAELDWLASGGATYGQ